MHNLAKRKKEDGRAGEEDKQECMEGSLGNGSPGRVGNPGFCSGPNHSCIKILRALNTENTIVLPYIMKNKNFLSLKINARSYNQVLFFQNDSLSFSFES